MQRLQTIKNALLAVGVPVSHYMASKQPDQYIVWAEDAQGEALWADGRMTEQTLHGTIDYFTRMEHDTHVQDIQNALTGAEISYRLNSIQYEDESQYIHYEWLWEVI